MFRSKYLLVSCLHSSTWICVLVNITHKHTKFNQWATVIMRISAHIKSFINQLFNSLLGIFTRICLRPIVFANIQLHTLNWHDDTKNSFSIYNQTKSKNVKKKKLKLYRRQIKLNAYKIFKKMRVFLNSQILIKIFLINISA